MKPTAGTVWSIYRYRRRELVMLVPVPMEDGGYASAVSRWILVGLGLGCATWDNQFHDTPEKALASQSWMPFAESVTEAYARMLGELRP